MKQVKDIMNPIVILVEASTPVPNLIADFMEQGIAGAPVVDRQGRLLGMVSRSDVARHWAETAGQAKDPAEYTAADVMTPFVFQVAPEDSVGDTIEVMQSAGVHRMVVTRHGFPVGIVTTMDLVNDYKTMVE
ncbi:MAG: HPP family protein [Vulcanimicrobiota bacterium]